MSDYNNSDHKPMSTEQANKLGEQTYEKNQKELAKSLHIAADDDGKYSFFGIEIPKSIAPAINIAVDTLVAPVSNQVANVVYHHSKSLAKGMGQGHDSAHQIALAAELTARWGIILANPISKFVSANTKFGQERYALHRELKSVCEATGAKYNHNRVVNAALAEVHQRYTDNLTLIVPSLLSLIPQAAYGIQKQRESRIVRDAEHAGTAVTRAVDDVVNTQLNKITDNIKLQMQEDKLREEQYKLFKQNHGREVHKYLDQKYGNSYSTGKNSNSRSMADAYKENPEKYLRKYFEDNVWSEAVKRMREAEKAALKKGEKPHTNAHGAVSDDRMINNLLYYAPIASAAGEGMSASIRESQKKTGRKACSYVLINKLKEQMQGKQSEQWVHDHVVEIFQQLEEDMGNTKFAGGLLEKLRDNIKEISQYIASGKLDALALVKLAGEDIVIDHRGKTKTFKTQESIQKVLDEMCCTQIIKDSETPEKDFLGRFAMDQLLVKDALKKSLASMPDGDEKDLIIAVMPAEVLEHVGLTRDDIRTHRKHAHANLHKMMASAIVHIAAMEEDLLKTHGLSTKEIETIKKLSSQIEHGQMEQLEKMVDARDDIVTAVAVQALNEQIAGNSAVWTERVKEASTLEERISKIKAEKAEKAEQPAAKHSDNIDRAMDEKSFAEREERPVERAHASQHEKHASHEERHAKHKGAEDGHHLGA